MTPQDRLLALYGLICLLVLIGASWLCGKFLFETLPRLIGGLNV